MIENDIYLSIITLSKNDNEKFYRTLKSIRSQKKFLNIEWLIIDGSDYDIQDKKLIMIDQHFQDANQKHISVNFINTKKLRINGIYPCMNYGKKIAKGRFILFLNSGDIFFNDYSSQILLKNSINVSQDYSLIFGQAKIVASSKINWIFPGKRLKNIAKWIRFFEPNHQSMMISNKLAKEYDFENKYGLISDGYWKRLIIRNAIDLIYIKTPLVKFYLDGVSSIKPSKKNLIAIIENKKIRILRKFIFIFKFILPNNLYQYYYQIQKFKSFIVDLII